MFGKFYPKEYVASPYELDYKSLYGAGYRGILFDIDNTLVMHGADADADTAAFVRGLQDIGFSICLLSNNNEKRVRRFNKNLGLAYIHKAGKPKRKAYQDGMAKMGCSAENTLFIGDQIFTDIYGANKAGVYSILVKPIAKKEEIQIVLKRIPEKVILYFYRRGMEGRVSDG